MSGPEYDAEFEAYLRGRVRLDRRLPRSVTRLEPPAELDRMVIGMARQAIQPLPNAPLFRPPKWAVPLTMAASLLVSFALMLDVGLRQGMPQETASEPLLVEMSNPQVPPARAPATATELAAPAAAPTARESPRASLFRTFRQRLATNRLPSSHRGAAASAPAPAVAADAANAVAARAAEPAAAEVEEARYGAGHAPAPFRLASAPAEMDTVVVIGTRIAGGPLGTR